MLIFNQFSDNELFKGVASTHDELVGLHFEACRFERCDFSETIFRECVFSECIFEECNLAMAKIPESRFEQCDFVDSKMIGVNWTEAHWRKNSPKKKVAFPISFLRCTLDYSIFISMNLTKARFVDCSLREVGFEDTDMECVSFGTSDLSGALFSNTRLDGSDLSLARNYTIDVCRNSIKKTRFAMPEAISLLYALEIELS